ncbi:Rpn family recombination-promoting nuclease/putative transposase [Nocardia seriolae]|uniref:Rpn family recombination-promoting nuclease/putative transposase n=1 Tax=Nocardia seriolae TaxID=37332 RepID=UPI0018AD18F6|nr:Rpn family recombination-promoting nuclease/putative transposase [Nocardia seriolae]
MAKTPTNSHDAYFRHVLARPPDVASELQAVLPEELAARLDWNNLTLQSCSFVSQHLRSRFSDLLFRTRLEGHEAFVYLLIEHQSRPDRLMPVRLLEYQVAIWNRYVREHPDFETLPIVVPLVIHASPDGRRWNVPTELSELLDIDPATRAVIGDYLPRFRFLLDDLTKVELPTLLDRRLTPPARVLFVLLKIASGNKQLGADLLPLVDDLEALLAGPDGEADFECVVTYILTVGETRKSDLGPLIDRLGPRAREVMMTTAEQLRAEGEARGEARGSDSDQLACIGINSKLLASGDHHAMRRVGVQVRRGRHFIRLPVAPPESRSSTGTGASDGY